ncbi:hypothetical protein PpBr36_08772 [Pyricularia pennisetigena]|uniref:hypothetical protein n=1 Tax=Pyricularia pennisetigena TaxID=1578925 RepID=UPI0011534DFE|nr:hypothetical protein PpBr36_08772 [Pyricularia pennisetigena]TLS24450.1 hypothetical protein PpBr36_08772 [Pyricularia pennisetigena]
MAEVKAVFAKIGHIISAQLILIAFGLACLLAYFFPHVGVHGGTIKAEYSILFGAVGFIFLVSGLQLPYEKLRTHSTNWRLHIITQGISFLIIPLITLAIIHIMIAAGNLQTNAIDISVLVGMIVLSCIPTTIASNVVFTRNAGGEDAAAIVEVVIGNVFGAFISPALVYAFMPKLPEFDEWQPASPSTLSAMYQKVAQQLGLSVLIPLAVGQILRFFFPKPVKWALEKLYLGKISTICLALLVWTTFCGAFATGALYVTPKASLIFNIFMNIGLYLLFTLICFFSARPPLGLVTWAQGAFEKKPLCKLPALLKRVVVPKRMSKEQTIAVCFCGAAKTTSLGIPLVTAMWSQSDNLRRAFVQIPVLLYTIEQVFIAQLLVYFFKRYMKRGQKDSGTDEDTVADPVADSLEDASEPSVPADASEKQGTEPSLVDARKESQMETAGTAAK